MRFTLFKRTILIGKYAKSVLIIGLSAILIMTGGFIFALNDNNAGAVSVVVDGASPVAVAEPEGAQANQGQEPEGGSGNSGGEAPEGAIPPGLGAGGYSLETDAAIIHVYVTGAVKNPGVYALEKNSMVVDAVEVAGGLTDEADEENINMVYRLESNTMLNIGRKADNSLWHGVGVPAGNMQVSEYDAMGGSVGSGGAGGGGTGGSGSGNAGSGAVGSTGGSSAGKGGGSAGAGENDGFLDIAIYGSAVSISESYGGMIIELKEEENEGGPQDGGSGTLININTATRESLVALPGIGNVTAGNIINYREKNDGFKRIEDIMKVTGIGQAKFNAIKDMIAV